MSKESELEPPRTIAYKKDLQAEQILIPMNDTLSSLERRLVANFESPRYPSIFIVGAPRSGTTLLTQLLINSYKIGYINNVIARFWQAPYIGARLASTFKYTIHDSPALELTSDLGATSYYLGPSEFGYFWRRWFKYGETHQLSKKQYDSIDIKFLRQEIGAIESVFKKPLLLKNPVLSLHIRFLADALPKAVFIRCSRESVYTAQSLLLSRIKYYNNKDAWFSMKPNEYTWLKYQPYPDQIAGQIFYIEQQINCIFEELESNRYLNINYEILCEKPKEQLGRVARLFEGHGCKLLTRKFDLPQITSKNKKRIDEQEFQLLHEACSRLFNYEEQ